MGLKAIRRILTEGMKLALQLLVTYFVSDKIPGFSIFRQRKDQAYRDVHTLEDAVPAIIFPAPDEADFRDHMRL
jgi:hypothetical protein